MKIVKKLLIILLVIIVLVSATAYIDYFVAKTNNTAPKVVLKEKLDDNTTLYTGLLYKVWYCKTNKTYTFGSYSDKDAICPKDYKYEEGYYTNALGIKISKRNIQLLTNDGIYTSEMIENMNSDSQVNSAIHVAYEYGKIKYKVLENKSSDNKNLVIFPEFKETDGNYSWVFSELPVIYCLKDQSIAKYEDNKCGSFESIKMDKEWCDNYEYSTLIYEDGINKYCENN